VSQICSFIFCPPTSIILNYTPKFNVATALYLLVLNIRPHLAKAESHVNTVPTPCSGQPPPPSPTPQQRKKTGFPSNTICFWVSTPNKISIRSAKFADLTTHIKWRKQLLEIHESWQTKSNKEIIRRRLIWKKQPCRHDSRRTQKQIWQKKNR